MKYLLPLIAVIISISGISQPNKNTLDSAVLTNDLVNWSKGTATIRGSQNLRVYSLRGLYFSAGAGTFADTNKGVWNIAIGPNAGDHLAGGSYNTFLGKDAGQNTTMGSDNFAVGWDPLRDNTFGSANIAIVQDALRSNTRGSYNIALGKYSLFTNTVGNHNTGIGFNTLNYLEQGDENIAIGPYAGGINRKSYGGVYIGSYAGERNDASIDKTLYGAIYIGQYAGINSANSYGVTIGYNVQSEGDYKINIGNVYKGDILTGNAEVKSISISGRQVTIDDNYLYVKTSTGILKAIPLQDITATSMATTSSQTIAQQSFPIYSTTGQLIGFGTIKLNSTIIKQ